MFVTLPIAILTGAVALTLGSAAIVVAFVLGAKLGPHTPSNTPPQAT